MTEFNDLQHRLRSTGWTAGVIGLGYVGLPLLVAASDKGIEVVGFDVSDGLIDSLNSGRSHIDDISDEEVGRTLELGATYTSDASALGRCDVIFICVPSPLGRNRQPDLSYIEAAARTISDVSRAGQLIVLESTSYPGTTEEIIVPAIEGVGLSVGEEVFVAFSPERVSPGDSLRTEKIPKVIGGVTEQCGLIAAAAYENLVPSVHIVSSARAAEMTKLLENTYRAVNIGLINEMAQLAHVLDINIWEVVQAAGTKPFGFQAFYPGPGVGGHCIPLDPQYLAWRAREARFSTRFIDTAEQVNSQMPEYTAGRVADLLNRNGLPVFGSRILGIGIAYKAGISDDRESASIQVLDELKRRGALVSALDPVVGRAGVERHGFLYVEPDSDVSSFDLILVLTDHPGVDYARLANEAPLVFDGRGVYHRLGEVPANVWLL